MKDYNTSNNIVESILKQYHTEFIFELEKANTMLKMNRISDSGKPLEFALKALLQNLLPDYVGITRGIIFDSSCNKQSKEIDLLLYTQSYFSGFVV